MVHNRLVTLIYGLPHDKTLFTNTGGSNAVHFAFYFLLGVLSFVLFCVEITVSFARNGLRSVNRNVRGYSETIENFPFI